MFVVNQQKYDARYILTSLSFARNLFNYDTEVSAVELKLKPGADVTAVQRKIARILGDEFVVLDRYEQQADVFRIMEIEKFISYLFLTFILAIACFNVIGSLSMLILDKREDVETLRNLGADDRLIARIFLFEGRLISLFGALSGIVLGLLLCYIQQRFGIISLGGGNGSFIVDAYPVSVHVTDVVLIFITVILVILAFVAIFRAWVYYTASPWTRDARFSADIVAIAPDVSGLISQVNVKDNQLVKKDQVLFVIDQPRYQKALAQAEADVAYYQTLAQEKRVEAGRRNKLGVQAMSREEIDQANNVLQTVEHQLAKAVASRDLARLDLERTVIRAPADGWVTNLNVYTGEFITRGSTAVALVKENTFYVMAYLEETKLEGVRPGYRAEITPLGSSKTIKGTVDSIAAGVTNASSSSDSKGMASVDSNLEWVRLAQRVPVRIRLDHQQGNLWPSGTTATVVITGQEDRDTSQANFFQKLAMRLREFG